MRHRGLVTTCCALIVLLGVLAAAGSASAHRWPVIGCDELSQSYENHYDWEYKPSGLCQTGGPLGTTTGIWKVHWSHWGRRQATGSGLLIDGLGFAYSARMTAYDLYVTHNFLGEGTYASWYRKLHVISKGGVRGGARRGPFNIFIPVSIQE